MSVRKQALKYTAAAIAIAAIIIVSSTFYLNPPAFSGKQGALSSKLVIQLTDPPIVPRGTSSLNLTYSSIALLVGEPASGGKLTTTTVTVPGSATLDLLKLQNVSQTIALAKLPNDSVIYSFAFTVTSISIDVNGTKSPVTLATGGSTLTVTLAKPSAIEGAYIALLRLNPVIVNTPGGYQMIPSAVGIIRAEGQGEQNEEQVGSQQQLKSEDEDRLEQARGNLTASLTALSVSGNSTTISVQVQNVGNASVVLNAIGIHGNFTAVGQRCVSQGSEETETRTETHTEAEHTTTTSTTTSTSTRSTSTEVECEMEHADEVVFVPVNSTVSGTACVPLKMGLVNGERDIGGDHGLALAKGQCAVLTFSGPISFGESKFVLVPSVGSGQVYEVHVIASEGANVQLFCSLPLTPHSCSVVREQD